LKDFVHLYWKRNRGWPWPEDSWGLTPMYGEDGWCRSCGVPRHEQIGSLTLQRKGFSAVNGAWVPNWQFDAFCVDGLLGAELDRNFDLDLREVAWRGSPPGVAAQIVVPSVGTSWFEPEELQKLTEERHGKTGATCPECGVWRWMPLVVGMLPPLRADMEDLDAHDVAASPEWFGDGWKAFRQIIMRRELAERLARASPRDFKVLEVLQP